MKEEWKHFSTKLNQKQSENMREDKFFSNQIYSSIQSQTSYSLKSLQWIWGRNGYKVYAKRWEELKRKNQWNDKASNSELSCNSAAETLWRKTLAVKQSDEGAKGTGGGGPEGWIEIKWKGSTFLVFTLHRQTIALCIPFHLSSISQISVKQSKIFDSSSQFQFDQRCDASTDQFDEGSLPHSFLEILSPTNKIT